MAFFQKLRFAMQRPIYCLEKAWDTVIPPPFLKALKLDKLPRTHFAYGLYNAAAQARAIGIPKISAIEFGVAGGNGLVALENCADLVEKETGVTCEVYGFDAGEGMPKALDYRDLPYVWQPGFFKMDVDRLKARLRRSTLILGPVEKTVPEFIDSGKAAPIGFVSIDVDYYSSTVSAMKVFDRPTSGLIPRVFCYLDDIIGDDWELHSRFAGELLAVEEFNEQHPTRKIAPIYGLARKRIRQRPWNEQMFVLHCFDHPQYNIHVYPNKDWHLPLAKKG